MSAHTPEPWEWAELDHSGDVHILIKSAANGTEVASDFGSSWPEPDRTNARRITACVNACAGISTEALEGGVVQELVHALKLALPFLDEHGPSYSEDAIRAVLAKVKP